MYKKKHKLTVSAKVRACQNKPLSWGFRVVRGNTYSIHRLKNMSIYSTIKESEQEILKEKYKPGRNKNH